MSRRSLSLPAAAVLAASVAACAAPPAPAASGTTPSVPLYAELGTYHYAVSTGSPEAQQYFDQGMRLSYAFNHAEGIRAFQHAALLDPQCAMCFWGVAYALGPNINAPITPEAAKAAWDAIGQARLASRATEKERAFIDALATRYAADPAADRVPLDKAYAAAMRTLAARYPDDTEAGTLYAQSLMDTSPWNYWDRDGKPREFTNDVLAALESVLHPPAGSHRRHPPVHSRRRGVAGSEARRTLCGPPGRAGSRRGPPRPHARAHLPAHRAIPRRLPRERQRGEGRRGVPEGQSRGRQHDVRDRLRAAQLPLLRDLGVARGAARRFAEGRQRSASADARGHAARSGDGRDGPAHDAHTPLHEGVVRDVGRRAGRTGAARGRAVHDRHVADGTRPGIGAAWVAWTKPRPRGRPSWRRPATPRSPRPTCHP